MSDSWTSALEELRAFVARHPSGWVREFFPSVALERLGRVTEELPEDVFPVLSALVTLAHRYDDATDARGRTRYEGADLRRQSLVAPALGRCAHPDAERILAELLRSVQRARRHAQPGGTPDIDKYDRDDMVERSEDLLALACAKALADRGARSPDAVAALRAARDHRDADVRGEAIRAIGLG